MKAVPRWEKLLPMLDGCRARGMNVILLAHAKIERFSPPDADPYDRWQPDFHKLAAPLLQEWADEVLFATYHVSTIQRDGKGSARCGRGPSAPANGSSTRREAPTHAAKRRIQLPDQLPLDWSEYQR